VYKDNDIYIYVSAVKKNSSDTLLPCWWNVSEDVWFHMTRKRQLKRIEWKAGEREREGWQKKRRYACCFAFGSMKTDIYFSSKMAHLHSFQPTDKQVGENLEFAAPSVCRNEKDGRARKSAEERAGPIRGANPWRQTSVPLRSSSWRVFFCFFWSARLDIISYTREKNFGMIENSLDLTERRGRPWLEMRKHFTQRLMIWKRRWGNLIVRLTMLCPLI